MRKLIAMACMALMALVTSSAVHADHLVTSASFTIDDPTQAIKYDFSGADLAGITPKMDIVQVVATYSFKNPTSGEPELIAGLELLNIDESLVNPNTGFKVRITVDGPQTKVISTSPLDEMVGPGLPFSDQLTAELLGGSEPGMLTGQLVYDQGGLLGNSTLEDYFTNKGGQIKTTLSLLYREFSGNGGNIGGGEIPEPSSILMWGLISVVAVAARRRLNAAQA